MRILINDFGGYPFPIELSRYLAKEGYTIMHCYLSNINTPHGNMDKKESDVDSFQVGPVELKRAFKKYSPIGRYKGEIEYANELDKKISSFKPAIVLSANTPLFAQNKIFKLCKQKNIRFIYWCQDIHSIAIEKFFSKKLPFFGKIISSYFSKREINLLQQSDYVITIAQSFNEIFTVWGIPEEKMTVIQNWGPFSEITILGKQNEWSKKHNLNKKTTILYSGTLGLKHNPMLIVEAAKQIKDDNVVFVVISEGLGAEIIKEQREINCLNNLLVLPFQDYGSLSQVLSSADILLAILEPEASLFSVPSKVLTYLCSGKSILLSVPYDNLSAEVVVNNNAGLCVEPGNDNEFIEKLRSLINDTKFREQLGNNGRQYAMANFPIPLIAANFIKVFNKVNSN